MPSLHLLLDQNIPIAVSAWLRTIDSDWTITHVNDLGFQGRPDSFLFKWAQEQEAIVVTYDEDFADARFFSLGRNYGVIRLRVWPTTAESTTAALQRLFNQLPLSQWAKKLIIIDSQKIRIRDIN